MEESMETVETKEAESEDLAKRGECMLPVRFPGRRRAAPDAGVPIFEAHACRNILERGKEECMLPALDRRMTERRGADRRGADCRNADRYAPDRRVGNQPTIDRRGADRSFDGAGARDRRGTTSLVELPPEGASSIAQTTEQEPCFPSWLCGDIGAWAIVEKKTTVDSEIHAVSAVCG